MATGSTALYITGKMSTYLLVTFPLWLFLIILDAIIETIKDTKKP
jgi:hypothetical protein